MLYSELLKLAVRNTRRRGKRTWLTMIGVIIGVTAIISLIALGQGLEQAIVQEFEELGANYVFIAPSGGELTDSDISIAERAPGVDEAIGYYETSERISFRGEEKFLSIYGVNSGEFENFRESQGLTMSEGRELRTTDQSNVVAGPDLKSGFFDRDTDIRSQLVIGGENFQIVGYLGESGDPGYQESIIMDLERMREIYDLDDDLTGISASISPGFEPDEVRDQIEEEFRRDRNQLEGDEDITTFTPDDILDALQNILGVVQGIVVGIASIALFVGGIGIMNTTYMSISERTQEIGTMKAIGAKKRHISALFVFEAGIIGMIGSIIGLIIGLIISNISIFAIDTYTNFSAAQIYSPELALGAVIFGFVLGVISGLLPARKAANMKPVEALKQA